MISANEISHLCTSEPLFQCYLQTLEVLDVYLDGHGNSMNILMYWTMKMHKKNFRNNREEEELEEQVSALATACLLRMR